MREVTIERAAELLAAGKPAIFPTETVLGVGVSVAVCPSPAVLYAVKNRPPTKPIAWLIGDASDLDRYGAAVPPAAHRLASAFWPGSLTLIVRASSEVPPAFRSRGDTVGLRMPANTEALDLIARAASPLATTSANVSGMPAPRTVSDLDATFADRVGAVVAPLQASNLHSSGVASTIVDCTQTPLRIVRIGGISPRQIEDAIGESVSIDVAVAGGQLTSGDGARAASECGKA